MYKYILIDSEYCSMGRWISVIVGEVMDMKLYEGKDLIALADENWLTEQLLEAFDNRLITMSLEEVKRDQEMLRVHQAMSKAITKAIKLGPCIIHERAAGEILKNNPDCLKVFLYNSKIDNKILRAIRDKTFDLKNLSNDEIIKFIKRQDYKRKIYRDAVSKFKWGDKESYDMCLDSDVLSREKCAEILIEAMHEPKLDPDKCTKIIKNSFTWTTK